MKNRIITAIFAGFMLLALSACSNKPEIGEEFFNEVNSFKGMSLEIDETTVSPLGATFVILNTTDKEVTIMLSEAEKQAEILKAEGEAEYMKILSEAYADESKTDFYSFVRSLDALEASMTGDNKTVILSEDSPIAQIFNGR